MHYLLILESVFKIGNHNFFDPHYIIARISLISDQKIAKRFFVFFLGGGGGGGGLKSLINLTYGQNS